MATSHGAAAEIVGGPALVQVHRRPGNHSKQRDPSYLFTCHLAWRNEGNIQAYQQLVAALDDPNDEVRAVAEQLLHRPSPRPQPGLADKTDRRNHGIQQGWSVLKCTSTPKRT